MIITCVNCNKKFNVNSDLIPEDGRTIQCGSCNHVWFFKKDLKEKLEIQKKDETKTIENQLSGDTKIPNKTINTKNNYNKTSKKKSEIVKYQHKNKFSFSTFLSYIIVAIISFCALIILIDTFKSPLYNIFPGLELILYSLFETLKDIQLFIKDLI
tara:strand:+ start:115 stop:582 length:468 start_codon:yes stop_codon:yes gene_type:complete